MKLLLFLLLFTVPLLSGAQSAANFGKVWVQGSPHTFATTFNSNGTTTNTKLDTTSKAGFLGFSNSNICDSFGNVVLVCRGWDLFDRNLDLVENGDSLSAPAIYNAYAGDASLLQMSIILPFANHKYYVINTTYSDSLWNLVTTNPTAWKGNLDDLNYHVVDISANGGLGKVTRRMVPLIRNGNLGKSRMTACRHGNGIDWWLFRPAHDTNMVYKWLFKQDTVLGPFVQGFPEPHTGPDDLFGQAAFSKDGSRYASATYLSGSLFVADFDRCYGSLSNPRTYPMPSVSLHNPANPADVDWPGRGVAFSPSGRFVYVCGGFNVFQLDLNDGQWTTVGELDTVWSHFQVYANLFLAPNGKVYVGNMKALGNTMSVINNPDVKGMGCGFCKRCLRFPAVGIHQAGVTTPPNMPNYALGAQHCWPQKVEALQSKTGYVLYPNPAGSEVVIRSGDAAVTIELVELLDVSGRVLMQQRCSGNTAAMQVSHLPTGTYFIRVTDRYGKQTLRLGKD